MNSEVRPGSLVGSLAGERIVSVSPLPPLTVVTDRNWSVVVESAVCMRWPEGAESVGDGSSPEAVAMAAERLLGLEVAEASVQDDGGLVVVFACGTVMRVASDADFESWLVSGPGRQLVVGMPGGLIAQWPGS